MSEDTPLIKKAKEFLAEDNDKGPAVEFEDLFPTAQQHYMRKAMEFFEK